MHRVSYPFIICLFHLNDAAGTVTGTTLPTREISPEWLSKTLSFEETTNTNAKGNTNTNANHLRNSQNQHQHQHQRRQLPRVTGDVWRACSGNTTDSKQTVAQNTQEYTNSIYEYTKYDDPHSSTAACTCFYDKESNEYWAQCALNDQTCNNKGACTRTHEFFLFSDSTGDLTQKSSCQLCKDVGNCEGIMETCTLVAFDPIKATPVKCVLTSINEDGSQTRCDDCTICRDDQTDDYGVFVNNCFGGQVSTPVDTCDTSGTAHLHNFQPVPNPGSVAIGGSFGSICQNNNNNKNRIELSLYGSVKYSDEYFANCECQDPTQGTIACDLYVEEHRKDGRKCFANECTEVTELFYFDPISGTMNEKMTCDYTHRGNNNHNHNGNGNLNGSGHTHDGTHNANNGNNGNGNHTHAGPLCSIVEFSTDTGEPIDCSMFSSTTLETCNDCSICRNDMIGEYGIRFNCFGSDVGEANCLSNKGRAVYNLGVGLQQSQTQPQQQTTTTTTSTTTTVTTAEVDGFEKSKPSQSTANNFNSDSDDTNNSNNNKAANNNFISEKKKNWERQNKKNQSMVLGICLGGIALVSALAVAVTLYCSGRHQKAASEPPPMIAPKQVPVAFATELDDPPTALVDQTGTPMVKDPTPIVIT